MTDATDMSIPVTRGEFYTEIAKLATKAELEAAVATLDATIAKLATKVELETWGGALLARIESGEQRLVQRMDAMEQRLLVEIGRHTRAVEDTMARSIAALDDKYKDLPGA